MRTWAKFGCFLLLSAAAVGYEAWGQATTQPTAAPTTEPSKAGPEIGQKSVTPSGLGIIVNTKGNGVAKKGDTVLVHYTGRLENGKEFDSSLKRGQPFPFKLGEGHVIQGWEEGVLGMEVGERRQLIIPPNLGYGAEGSPGAIPPNATLTFDVELVGLLRQ